MIAFLMTISISMSGWNQLKTCQGALPAGAVVVKDDSHSVVVERFAVLIGGLPTGYGYLTRDRAFEWQRPSSSKGSSYFRYPSLTKFASVTSRGFAEDVGPLTKKPTAPLDESPLLSLLLYPCPK